MRPIFFGVELDLVPPVFSVLFPNDQTNGDHQVATVPLAATAGDQAQLEYLAYKQFLAMTDSDFSELRKSAQLIDRSSLARQGREVPDRLAELSRLVCRFRDERDWQQFHTPRQLAAAISIEAAELQEVFLWKSDDDAAEQIRNPHEFERLRQELADVFIYTLLFADRAGIDLDSAVRDKLALNEERYPVDRSKGRSTKYRDIPSNP